MGKYLDKAKEIRNIPDKHYSCTQTVLMSFSELTGLDEKQCKALGTHFGAGMFMGTVCGSLTGGLMVLGLLGIRDKETREALQQAFKDSNNGEFECAKLLAAAREKGMERKDNCDGQVYKVVAAIEKILEERQ